MTASKLCIGTAQFGLEYGITNSSGLVPDEEVSRIISTGISHGITMIDTASCYGVAEERIGRCIRSAEEMSVISKLSKGKTSSFSKLSKDAWNAELEKSLSSLQRESLEGLMLHHAGDLKKRGGGYLLEWLVDIKEQGLVKNLGVSVYGPEEVEGIDWKTFSMIQIPYSIYDQRFELSGHISSLSQMGVQVFARSIYLQGLILARDDLLFPEWVDGSTRKHHVNFVEACKKKGKSQVEVALGFVLSSPDIYRCVIGLTSERELSDAIDKAGRVSNYNREAWRDFALTENRIIDPRRW